MQVYGADKVWKQLRGCGSLQCDGSGAEARGVLQRLNLNGAVVAERLGDGSETLHGLFVASTLHLRNHVSARLIQDVDKQEISLVVADVDEDWSLVRCWGFRPSL
jgi:hypothetical protein